MQLSYLDRTKDVLRSSVNWNYVCTIELVRSQTLEVEGTTLN